MIKVRALQKGYIGHKRKYDGDVFYVEDHLFSKIWMENLGGQDVELTPVKTKVDMSYSMTRLFDYCKEHKLKNYSGLEHKDLVDAINSGELIPEVAVLSDNKTEVKKTEVVETKVGKTKVVETVASDDVI